MSKGGTLLIGLLAFFVTELTRSFWRPYVYQNNAFDYYFSDTVGNSFGTVTAIFIILSLSGKGTNSDWWLVIMVITGLIFYELLGAGSQMDPNDIFATLLFGFCSAFIYRIFIINLNQTEKNHA